MNDVWHFNQYPSGKVLSIGGMFPACYSWDQYTERVQQSQVRFVWRKKENIYNQLLWKCCLREALAPVWRLQQKRHRALPAPMQVTRHLPTIRSQPTLYSHLAWRPSFPAFHRWSLQMKMLPVFFLSLLHFFCGLCCHFHRVLSFQFLRMTCACFCFIQFVF